MRPRSLKGRLVVVTALVSAATMALLALGLQVLLDRSTSNDSVSILRARVDAAAATLRLDGDRLRVLETRGDSLDQNLWVYDDNGTLVDGSPGHGNLGDAVEGLSTVTGERSIVVDRYRLLARPAAIDGNVVGVIVAVVDLTPYERAEHRALLFSLALGVLAVASAAAAASAATTYSLGKVRTMARTADEWREHDLRRRFALSGRGDELTELGATLDRMLDRIEHAILTERRLTDEVAHELRTPLTTIRSEAELAQQQGGPTDALAAIVAATDRMAASIATMLQAARSAVGERETCTAADVLLLASRYAPQRPGVDLIAVPAELPIAAPENVVTAALAPMVDNAVRHARSAVRLSAETRGGRTLLIVDDDGPGVAEADLDLIFQPGYSTSDDGAGLGLALARRLAGSVSAELRAEARGHGRFVLDLPQHM